MSPHTLGLNRGLGAVRRFSAIRLSRVRKSHNGYSYVYVLTAALILIAVSLTLRNQANSTSVASSFQNQALQARTLARSGMLYFVSQLNKEVNRNLLVLPESRLKANAGAETTLWTEGSAATYHVNPCAVNATNGPDLSDLNLGSDQSNGGYLFVASDGSINRQRNGATRAFRIINRPNSEDFRIAVKSSDSPSLIEDARGTPAFRLSVEAVLYKNSQSSEVVARTILQEDFQVVPKCCKSSYGGFQDGGQWEGHGNSIYALNRYDLAGNRCMLPGVDPDSYGIIVGSALRADGAVIKNSQGLPVNPLYCVSADEAQCSAASNTSGNQMQRIDAGLPKVPVYPGEWSNQVLPPVLRACASAIECSSTPLLKFDPSTGKTLFNAAVIASSGELPANCTLYRSDVHCIYSRIDLSTSSNDIIFVSGNNTRRIRLYFPLAGSVIIQNQDKGTLRHCKVSSCSGRGAFVDNTTDVSIFGSACPYLVSTPNLCGTQDITMKGSVREARFFVYAPASLVKLIGLERATFQGVIWARVLDIRGTSAIPTIPKTGVADVFHLLGVLPDENNTLSKSLSGKSSFTDLFPVDVLARGTSRYRFIGD